MTVNKIKISNRKVFSNSKGSVIKYVSKRDIFFKNFGEIYFNKVKNNKKKGWILHKKNFCIFFCIYGKVKFHFIDDLNKEKKIILNDKSNKVIICPPKIWFSIEGKFKESIITNLINSPHSDKEVVKTNKIKNYIIKN